VTDKKPARKPQPPSPEGTEQAKRVIREYIDNLREFIAKLREKMH
jgi:hypothetical protein